MNMKMRVWGGRPTLATEQGKNISSPEGLDAWLKSQPDGQVQVWAGRWWAIQVEAVPFTISAGKCHCAHPKYRSKKGLDTRDYPGFFAHEAWRKAKMISDFYAGIGGMAASMVERAKGGADK